MSNTVGYKGYAALIRFDDEDGVFVGRIAGLRDGVGFHADTVEGLRATFRKAVEDYVETCARIGKEPQKAGSGQMMLRVNREVQRKAALAAEPVGKSRNQWAEEVLGRAAQEARCGSRAAVHAADAGPGRLQTCEATAPVPVCFGDDCGRGCVIVPGAGK